MEDLQEQLSALAQEHGTDAIDSILAQLKTNQTPPPQCPRGQIWNGTSCVADIG